MMMEERAKPDTPPRFFLPIIGELPNQRFHFHLDEVLDIFTSVPQWNTRTMMAIANPICAASTDIKEVPNEVAIGTDATINASYFGRL